ALSPKLLYGLMQGHLSRRAQNVAARVLSEWPGASLENLAGMGVPDWTEHKNCGEETAQQLIRFFEQRPWIDANSDANLSGDDS
ncbi:MAG: hypothetical protein AAF266_15335, partial [Planctomycetota bacterium]